MHTRIVLERMDEHGVPVERVINAGGIPQHNPQLNQVYANVLGKPVLVPNGSPTSLGSCIVAAVAAGFFPDIAAAQAKLCLPFRTFTPEPEEHAVYAELFALYRAVYFAFGTPESSGMPMGKILPTVRRIAQRVHKLYAVSEPKQLSDPEHPGSPAHNFGNQER